MELLKRLFLRNHAMAIHLYFLAVMGTVCYGWAQESCDEIGQEGVIRRSQRMVVSCTDYLVIYYMVEYSARR